MSSLQQVWHRLALVLHAILSRLAQRSARARVELVRRYRHARAWRDWLRNPRPLGRRRTLYAAAVGVCLLTLVGSAVVVLIQSRHTRAAAGPSSGFMTFLDTQDHTRFRVGVDLSNAHAGLFSFRTPAGAQYYGGQASDIAPNGQSGTLGVHFDGTAQLIAGGATPASVQVHLNATVDPGQMSATAELSDQTNHQHFVMVTSIPSNAADIVSAVNQAIIQQDWATLYTSSSQELLGGMSQAQFAQFMTQQAHRVGVVTAIAVTSAPQVHIDPDTGITSFVVNEQATISLNGAAQTHGYSAIYLLEDGGWKLLSTKTIA